MALHTHISPGESHLGVLMVSKLAIRLKVCGFKPGRGDEFLRAIKIHSTPSLREEVKAGAPSHKSLWPINNHLQV
jgi:hypothetical protein